MAYVKTDDSHYRNIASAIRSLHDGEETYTPEEMAEYLSTEGAGLKPWNVAKGVTIFGVTGTLDVDNSKWPTNAPIEEDVVDITVKKYDVRADINDKFVLMQDDGNITVGYPLKEIETNKAFYNGHKLPDIGNAATLYIFRRKTGEYIYYTLNKGCEAYTYIAWNSESQQYFMYRSQDSAQHWSRYALGSNGVWSYEDGTGYYGTSMVTIGDVEVIWIGSDILNTDKTVLHHAAAYTYAQEANDLFTITSYDEDTTEFKARCWLRASYHTTGEYAGQITIDDFMYSESEGWNYIKNIRYCTRDALYFGDRIIWPKDAGE